jgi:hypothetical protein
MAHESFEDPETAALMNEHFVSIKVDREERPDLDNIYMAATQALTGSGGWPMSVFLTPDLRPFYAGTYFPPVPRYNMPSFKDVLSALAQTWREQRAEVERVSAQVLQHIQPSAPADSGQKRLTQPDLDTITKSLLESYDWGYGGWGAAPKFPQPMLIEFLFRRASGALPPQEQPLKAALHVLQAMARGGMYDVVAGGFARYSTDNFWRVPHFEKMLYDNAQLARVYLHAWQITREPFYKRIVIETLEFVRREMTDPAGGFCSSLDADSEGEEGQFYAWTYDQIRAALPDAADLEFFVAAYGITDRGNWEGKTVLQRALDDVSLAARFKITPEETERMLSETHSKLLGARSQRIRPRTDDKILTAWNAFMLQAFAEAGRVLDDQQLRSRYLLMATRSADFLLTALLPNDLLRRSWRAGNAGHAAFLEDFAALIGGLLELYQADFTDRWFVAAMKLADEMIVSFSDEIGGFFDTAVGAEPLLVRPRDMQDNATPSGNALACEALLKLAALTGRGDYRDLAERALSQIADATLRFPSAFGRWLSAADYALSATKQIAVVYEDGAERAGDLLEILNAEYRPNIIIATSPYPPSKNAPALLAERSLKDARPTAYVCENFICKLPVNSPEELRKLL